jgi:hypothetical protein
MGQSQNDPVMCRLIRTHVGRKIENQATKLTLIIVWIQGMYSGQELFHVEQTCVVATSMLLSKV